MAIAATGAYAKDKMDSNKDYRASSNSVQMHRVTQESLDRQITAKDLIGASVYDSAGEQIGNIADISVKKLVSKDTAKSYGQSNRDNDNSWDADNDSSLSADRNQRNSQSADNNRGLSADQNKRSSLSDRNSMGSMMGNLSGSQATAFISVGGLWGIGDDIVAVPVNSLSYDESEKRFTLNASKEAVVALAEERPTDFSEDYNDATYSAKQEFDEEVNEIRDAIRQDKDLMAHRGIMVSSESDQIVLYGNVTSEDAKERAEELAEKHTDKDIKNSITVKKNK